MKTFLLDLWHDLREKRLWPVAILLAVALAAVPLVLRKPAEEAPAPAVDAAPQAKPADAEAEALAVKALEEGSVPSSKLDTFSAKNPFRPLVKERSVEELASQLGSTQGTSDGAGPSVGGAGDSTSGGGGLSSGGDVGTADPGGDTGGDGGDGGGSDKPTTTTYAYVVDVTFTANDRKRRIKGMERLDILPSSANPLLLFLGVSDDAGNAVFLVDSTLSATGEGRCTPNPDECAFVYIGPGAQHMFTNEEGDSYTVQIDEIRKVKVKPDGSAARAAGRPKAKAAVGKPARRRFVAPILSDLVVVATGAANDSNSDTDRR
ncbi:MAG: hypothetical protein ACRDM7_18470 [Thermoleophilaceae bacterium]